MGECPGACLALIVPKGLVKQTKDSLEAQGKLDKRLKIRQSLERDRELLIAGDPANIRDSNFYIPTKVLLPSGGEGGFRDIIDNLGLLNNEGAICLARMASPRPLQFPTSSGRVLEFYEGKNPLLRTINEWLYSSGRRKRQSIKDVLAASQLSYMIYPPLLLLPASIPRALEAVSSTDSTLASISTLYAMFCERLKITHIALNAPIPARIMEQVPIREHGIDDKVTGAPNILRSPTGLTPLYGDFGPALLPDHIPAKADFDSAFWCTSVQNNIFQTWAPRYTMFSRGNITEKTRILNLDSLKKERLGRKPDDTSAVDLYAGIGYFAFSYVKARVGKVLCWEINPWSVEGLRRGSERNRWEIKVSNTGENLERDFECDERLRVFQESNERAGERICALRDKIPPVAHVNCGLLPSSKKSWEVAVQVLDFTGGWIHVHENIANKDIESRKVEIVGIFAELAKKRFGQKAHEERIVTCEHLELVKSFAPGVMHCVFDIKIRHTELM